MRTPLHEHLETVGYTVRDMNQKASGTHLRINNQIDIYPKSKKCFFIRDKFWSTYENEFKLLGDLKILSSQDKVGGVKPKTQGQVQKTISRTQEEKLEIVETILRNVEARMLTKKIVSRPRRILIEEIIKFL